MSKLRRIKVFSFVLPVVIAVFLFSMIGTVLANYFPNVYIGKVTTSVYGGGVNSTDPISENLDVSLYNDSELTTLVHNVYIRTGEEYGGYPGAIIATIFSSQEQRTAVSITTDNFNSIRHISQSDQPDDIATAVDVLQDTTDGVYSNVVELRTDLDSANLTDGLDFRFDWQDRALVRIIRDLEGGGNTTK